MNMHLTGRGQLVVVIIAFLAINSCGSEKHNRHFNMRRVSEPDNDMLELTVLQNSFSQLLLSAYNSDELEILDEFNPYTMLNKEVTCDRDAIFRTIDGTCNNLDMPMLGAAKTPFGRLVQNTYEDGVDKPRLTAFESQSLLPSAREVSLSVHLVRDNKTGEHSHLLMGYGQLIDHDFTLTAEAVNEHGEEIESDLCCKEEPPFEGELNDCFPISTVNDPVFRRTCIPLLRSAPVPPMYNTLSGRTDKFERSQMNDVTAFIDASTVYGSTNKLAQEVRDFSGGRLRASRGAGGEERLPGAAANPKNCENVPREISECSFLAGDNRNSEQAGLASMHTLFLREHNRIARELELLNPLWNDELLYQTARKILIATMQTITYQEFLPPVVGQNIMRQKKLDLDQATLPNAGRDPTIVNEISTAAFRFGHSLVRQTFTAVSNIASNNKQVDLADMFEGFVTINQTGNDAFLRGLAKDAASFGDRLIVSGLRDRLFDDEMDLMAFNIQRGRDHGIGSYMQIRKRFGLKTFRSYDAMIGETHDMVTVNSLRSVYPSPLDIELFPGGMSEIPQLDAILGETFSHIIGDQFSNLRHGDRFWFQRKSPVGFTSEQERAIRKVSLARIYCDNVGDPFVRRNMLDIESFSNPEISCKAIPSIDLSLWSDGLVDPATSPTTGLPPPRRPTGRGYRSHQRRQGSQTQNRNSNRRGRQNVPRSPRGQQRNSGGRVRLQNRIRAGNNRKSFLPRF